MGLSKQEIRKILTIKKPGQQGLCVSIYLPLTKRIKGTSVRKQVAKILPSLTRTKLKAHPKTKDLDRTRDRLAKRIKAEVQTLKEIGQGMVLLARVDPRHEQERPEAPFPKKEMALLSLPQAPEKEVTLGKDLDLDQLIWIKNRAGKALILNINQTQAAIFLLKNGDIALQKKEENPFTKAKSKKEKQEGPKRVKLGVREKTFYGLGANKVQKTKEKESRLFLNHLTREIKQEKDLKQDISYLVVFYSRPLEKSIRPFIEKTDLESRFEPLFQSIHLNHHLNKKQVKNRTQALIRKYQKRKTQKLIQRFRRTPGKYKQGWKEVVEAANLGKINTLFLKPRLCKKGVIDENGLPRLSSGGEGNRQNIVPRIVELVMEKGGNIRILEEDKTFKIAAGLRFS